MRQRRSALPESVSEYELDRRQQRIEALARKRRPPPCTTCPHSFSCKSQKLACASFARFVHKGWALRRIGVVPTRRWY